MNLLTGKHSKAALFVLSVILVIIGLPVSGWFITGMDPRYFWLNQFGGWIPPFVVLFIVPFGCYAVIRGFLEDIGAAEPSNPWIDWREDSLSADVSPPTPSRQRRRRRILEGRPPWTHRGVIRSRRHRPPKRTWGINRS